MAVAPFPIKCLRDKSWITMQTDDLLPGDVVSIGMIFTLSTYRVVFVLKVLLSSWYR